MRNGLQLIVRGDKMRTLRISLIAVGLIYLVILSPVAASARGGLYIGVGTSFGHGYSSHHYGYSGHHYGYSGHHYGYFSGIGLHSGYYNWLDHGGYYGSYWGWPSYWSGTSLWINDPWPVYVSPPVIVRRTRVITTRRVIEPVRTIEYKPANAKLFAELRNKKSEMLKALKIGDKQSRIKAIKGLAGYSFDDAVRTALLAILLDDADPELRKQVALALGKVKNLKVIAALEKVRIEDADEEVRRHADEAIRKIKAY